MPGSTNREGVGPQRRGQPVRARDMEGLRQGVGSAPLIRQVGALTSRFGNGQKSTPLTNNTSSASLPFIATSNSTYTNGAVLTGPGGTLVKELTADNNFYLALPWNKSKALPDNYYSFMLKSGDDYYLQMPNKFYVLCNEDYPSGAGAGIDDFDIYWQRDTGSLLLGSEADFPTGKKCLLDGFDNVNASDSSREYFNGKLFEASYDSANNIIFLNHPQF